MSTKKSRGTHAARATPLTVLVLQGGGALGAYQGGAFEALAHASQQPDWVAGISIGAINAALIAGNRPEHRTRRLRDFWHRVTASVPSTIWPVPEGSLRRWANDWAAAWGAMFGLPAFFQPRPGAALWPGAFERPSLYDTEPLHQTLLELVDFTLLNDGPTRLSVGAVDVQSGNFVYFDNRRQRIGPEHIMASGALPPGFPAVTVEGRSYWDGGLVSNTPLQHVVDHIDGAAATIFQIDLFSARGALPRTLAQVADREKDIRFSSRTRAVTDRLHERHDLHQRLRALAALLPPDRRADPQVLRWLADTDDTAISLVHLIHRHKGSETQTRDYEFSRTSMHEHWRVGHDDMAHSLRAMAQVDAAPEIGAFRVFDYTRPDTPATHPGARP
jgi:NTE family protein